MNNLNIKIMGVSSKFHPHVMIDDKLVKYKKNKFGSYEINYQTEKDNVQLKIFKYLELQSKFWYLWALLTFIISVFGVFEPRYDKKCIVIDCTYNIKLKQDNKMIIKFKTVADEGKATDIEGDCEVEEIENKFYVDSVSKKRWKILLACKIVLWVIAIVLIIFVISKKF